MEKLKSSKILSEKKVSLAQCRVRLPKWLLSLILWAGTVPFSKLLAKVFSFGVPAVIAFVWGFLFKSPIPALSVAFALLLFLTACREAYWTQQRRVTFWLQRRVEKLLFSEEALAKTLSEIAKKFIQEWSYDELDLVYWLDRENPSSGKFRRRMVVRFPGNGRQLLACVGRIRVGAHGKETHLCTLDELTPVLSCSQDDVFCLLLPIDVDQEDRRKDMHWHMFTILLYAPIRRFSTLTLTFEAEWNDLWAPLWKNGNDEGILLLEAKCKRLTIDVLAPQRSAKGDFVMKPFFPENTSLREASVEPTVHDSSKDRYRLRLSVQDAEPGTYCYQIRDEAAAGKSE